MPPRAGGLQAMRCALGYLRGYQREAAGAVAALLLVAAANLATPQLIRVAIDVGFTQAQPSVLAETVAGLVALAFAQFRDSPDGLSAARRSRLDQPIGTNHRNQVTPSHLPWRQR